jgi:hypothetical protein
MLTKILFTALVIALVVAGTRFQRGRALARATRVDEPGEPSGLLGRVAPRRIAYIIAAVLLVSAVAFYANFWRDWHEVVTVRVINTQSGDSAEYKVYKGTIEARGFETVDGWKVRVSDLERLEFLHERD